MTKALLSSMKLMADVCASLYNVSDDSSCSAFFDRISCWPPTEAGVLRILPCPAHIFPDANPNAYATRLCTNESKWEERSHYELCIGCSPSNFSDAFSIPMSYINARRYFIICANAISINLLAMGIVILLGNSRLRQYSRNILHMNIFLAFLLRSLIQLIAELFMSKGYFPHNVFERTDACNRTTTYFKEGQLLDCKLFTILMNYINSSVSHWFVFCEALYLYRLLRAQAFKDRVQWYILIGWLAPLYLTVITYTTRFILKKDLDTCWFEPSIYDWVLHGPNVVLQILNFMIFSYICILLIRKLNKTYRMTLSSEQRRFAKYSRLTRSTLILLPLFGIHYFLFMWNTKPMLIPNLILIHLTVHTISSSLQGLIVALIYTLINSEVQREMLRSLDRYLTRHYSSWEQPQFLRRYLNKLENERSYSVGYQTRLSTPIANRQIHLNLLRENYMNTQRPRYSLSNISRDDSNNAPIQELTLLNSTENPN